jgi:hypothetical protein
MRPHQRRAIKVYGVSPTSISTKRSHNDEKLRKQNPKLKFFRRRQLERIIVDTYGEARLPDSDDGRDLLRVMAHHLAQIGQGLIRTWVASWAPWLTSTDLADLIDDAGSAGHLWGADELGHYIGLDDSRRTRTKATTIGAIDCDQRQRARRRKRRRKLDARARREKAGAAPHSKSAAATQPWIKERISRATYYRRQRAARETFETNSRPAILSKSGLITNQSHKQIDIQRAAASGQAIEDRALFARRRSESPKRGHHTGSSEARSAGRRTFLSVSEAEERKESANEGRDFTFHTSPSDPHRGHLAVIAKPLPAIDPERAALLRSLIEATGAALRR